MANRGEGTYTKQEARDLDKAYRTIADTVIKIAKTDQSLVFEARQMKPADIKKYLIAEQVKILESMGAANPVHVIERIESSKRQRINDRIDVYVNEGYTKDAATKKVERDMLNDRFGKDNEVAARIMQDAGDDKSAIVYGAGHFFWREGDIDWNLANTPNKDKNSVGVMAIYLDDAKRIEIEADINPTPSNPNKDYFEPIKYSLTLDSMTWRSPNSDPVNLIQTDTKAQGNLNEARQPAQTLRAP